MFKVFFALLIITLFSCSRKTTNPLSRDLLGQVSTIDSLLNGYYYGIITLDQVKQYGDFGLGTFAGLDGEMIFLDGVFYQVKADGRVHKPPGNIRTPFACATFFESDTIVDLGQIPNMEALEGALDRNLKNKNIFYAIRIDGTFEYVKTRSVPSQSEPYPPLAQVIESQPTFEFRDIRGTIVGLRCPSFTKGLNLPGYHFHFLTNKKDGGGHLLELKMVNGRAQIDTTNILHMILPEETD